MLKQIIITLLFLVNICSNAQELTLDWVYSPVGPGTYNGTGNAMTLDCDNNLYVTGYYSGYADFDPSSNVEQMVTTFGTRDVFLAKYDSAGNYVWSVDFGGSFSESGTDITVDCDGNLYVTGNFSGYSNFDPYGVDSYSPV